MTEPEIREDDLIGMRVAHYRIVRLLQRGGMGVVYEAVHEAMPRRAAVKVLLTGNQSRDRMRFVQEAKACCDIVHEGLVKVFDCGELANGALYILMEYIEGCTLRQCLQDSPGQRLPLDRALSLLAQLADAMATVHAHRVIHRDLKPENIMLVRDAATATEERAKVLDFGIAKLLSSSAPVVTETQALLGTPLYMAPESADEHAPIDGQRDVYSLGCILYELLCGRPPFRAPPGSSANVVFFMHLKDSPVPPSRWQAGIPAGVEALMLRMLAKAPASRPTMVQVAAQARTFLQNPTARSVLASLQLLFVYRARGPQLAIVRGVMFASFIGALVLAWKMLFGTPIYERTVLFAAGSFSMGTDAAELEQARIFARRKGYEKTYELGKAGGDLFERETPPHLVKLSPFELDATETTNAQFSAFLTNSYRKKLIRVEPILDPAGRRSQRVVDTGDVELYNLYSDIGYGGIKFENETFVAEIGKEELPIVAVTWEGAKRYCESRNKRLPTEAEWEYAATNRGKSRFPWGELEPTCDATIIERGRSYGNCRGYSPSLPKVGSGDRSWDGVYDLGGSVSEWVADAFVDRYESCTGGVCMDPRRDQVAPDGPLFRVVRGGAWGTDYVSARAKLRMRERPEETNADTGIRCARSH